MGVEVLLDRLHARVTAWEGFRVLTAVTRGLLAVSFFSTGLIKVRGVAFTTLSVETPIGYFFDAMHRTGAYYRFLGASQMLAAVLLLLPRTATLGALVFFPIILNIVVITVALGFQGTPFITGPMLLASFYLLCWDYPRLKGVVFETPRPLPQPPVSWTLTLAVALGTQGAMGTLGGLRAGRAPVGDVALLVAGMVLFFLQWNQRRGAARA
jgi:hypothetical protein